VNTLLFTENRPLKAHRRTKRGIEVQEKIAAEIRADFELVDSERFIRGEFDMIEDIIITVVQETLLKEWRSLFKNDVVGTVFMSQWTGEYNELSCQYIERTHGWRIANSKSHKMSKDE
jgi:hypothetical protein